MIRLATALDAAEIAEIYGYYVDETPISFEEVSPSVEEMRRRIETTLPNNPWLVYCDSDGEQDRVVGYAYAYPHHIRAAYRWSVDIGMYLHHDYTGRGIGRRLYNVLLRILQAQRYRTVVAGIALPNAASQGLHDALGFTHIGTFPKIGYKFGQFRDVGYWTLRLPVEDEQTLEEPIPFAEIADNFMGNLKAANG